MRLFELESNNENTIYFTFITPNPPTYGYQLVLNKLNEISKGHDTIAFINPVQDPSTYPLYFDEVLKFCKKIFPQTKFHEKNDMKNPFQCLKFLSEQYSNVVFLTTDENVKNLQRLYDYADDWGIENFEMVALGDSHSGLPKGMKRSQAVKAAQMNDYDAFKKSIPTTDQKVISNLYLAVRKRLLDSSGNEDDSMEKVQAEESYLMLKAITEHASASINESAEKDMLNNKTLTLENFFDAFKKLKMVFTPKSNNISLGKDNYDGNYVIMMNTPPESLKQFMDVRREEIKEALEYYHKKLNENSTIGATNSGNVATLPNTLGTPIKRSTVSYDFVNKIKFSKSENKVLAAINEFTKKYGFIDKDAIEKIEGIIKDE